MRNKKYKMRNKKYCIWSVGRCWAGVLRLSVARASSGRPVEGVGRILMLARVIVIIISLSYHHMNFDHQHCDSSYRYIININFSGSSDRPIEEGVGPKLMWCSSSPYQPYMVMCCSSSYIAILSYHILSYHHQVSILFSDCHQIWQGASVESVEWVLDDR